MVGYYLGEIARRRMNPEFSAHQRTIRVKLGTASLHEFAPPCQADDEEVPRIDPTRAIRCIPLFVMNEGPAGNPLFSVDYAGARYSVPANPKEAGYSYSILALTRQLLAVNTSDKSAPPVTTVLTILAAR